MPVARYRTHALRDVASLVVAGVVIAGLTLLLRSAGDMSPTTVALALLLVVLATATLSRLWVAILVSVIAMLVLNFFFLPPVGTFSIADPQNWVALFAFLAVAIIASNLSAAAQDRAREALARRNEVTRLFDLSRDVLLTTETAGALDALAHHVARRFEFMKVAVCLPGSSGWEIHQGGAETVPVDTTALDRVLVRSTSDVDAQHRTPGRHLTVVGTGGETLTFVPLRHGARPIGVLIIVDSGLDVGTLDALAGVAAIAIERTQFLGERDKAELVRQKADLAATLLASLSHDLRTPLTAIRVAVENLKQDALRATDRRVQADAALLELDRLTRLFEDILDMARIDAAALRIDKQWVTPADIVDAASAHVRHALGGHPLHVDADASIEVEIDPKLTSAALAHLLENAVRYSPPGRPIAVIARITAEGLEVTVTDRGPGLEPSEIDHLFERFYRGRAARQLSFGTGMGLAITRGLLAAAGGRVWAENVPSGGARFSIVVPAAARAATAVP